MKDKGILTIVSGFSGVGKGTVMNELLEKYDNYALSISATTRAPRTGEIDGQSYFFLSRDEFIDKINNDELLEYAEYVGNYYGTPKKYVEDMLDSGKDVLLEIEVQGAMKVKAIMPEAITVFVVPPDAGTLKTRLNGRGTETEEVIKARLKRAVEESQNIDDYEYILVNDDLNKSVTALHELIQANHGRTFNNKEFINEIREEVKCFLKGE